MRSNGPCTPAAISQATKVQRLSRSLRSAFACATSKAAALISLPVPTALGSSLSSASSSAPDPVPISRMRNFSVCKASRTTASSVASITVSVSGRGTSTAGLTCRLRLQNSLRPKIRATGSRLSRRSPNASIAFISSPFSARSPFAISSARSMPSACAISRRASASAESIPAWRSLSASARRAAAMVRMAVSVTSRPRLPAARPDARSPAHR